MGLLVLWYAIWTERQFVYFFLVFKKLFHTFLFLLSLGLEQMDHSCHIMPSSCRKYEIRDLTIGDICRDIPIITWQEVEK